MGTLRAATILVVFAVITLAGLPLQAVFLAVSLPLARVFAWCYWRAVARLVGLRVALHGRPFGGACVFVANHVSWLDIIALGTLRPLCFVAKREVAAWPLIGQVARLGRTVFVDRDRRHDASRASAEMAARLAAGDSLVLFAEGTSSSGNRVLPFRASLLSAAGLAVGGVPVPVQPVTIAYTRLAGVPLDHFKRPLLAWYGDMKLVPHLWQALRLGPLDVDLVFHAPFDPAAAGGRKALAGACEKAVRDGLVAALTGRALAPAGGSP